MYSRDVMIKIQRNKNITRGKINRLITQSHLFRTDETLRELPRVAVTSLNRCVYRFDPTAFQRIKQPLP